MEPIEENLAKSSKVHRLLKNVPTRRKSRHKTSVRLEQKMRRKVTFRTRSHFYNEICYKSNKAKYGKK